MSQETTKKTKKSRPTIGISIVSWRSWDTLQETLESYKKVGLYDFADRSVIYFQDLCDQDVEIAEKFGIDYIGGPNCGIANGMRNAANYLDTDYVLFLENDCPVIVDRKEVESQLSLALDYLERGVVDVMRFRSRLYPGEAFADVKKYLRYYKVKNKEAEVNIDEYQNTAKCRWLRRIFKVYNLHRMKGRSIYVEKEAEKLFPDVIKKTPEGIWICDSSCIDWTNQSVFCRKELFTDKLMRYVDAHPSSRTSNGFQSPERSLNCRWWRNCHLKIGQGEGFFTHNRFDGSWRESHPAYEKVQL